MLRPPWLAAAAVVAAALVAWWGTWRGQYVFDDLPALAENRALAAGDWWAAAFAPPHQPLANRPLATLSFVLDFAVFGPGPFGPHVTNLVLHAGNALLLLLVVRRALLAPNLGGRFDARRATGFAAAVALVWVVHPLLTDAVAYATQRSTLLFSGCLLLSLYALLRGFCAFAVVALALGMAAKEDLVAGPVLLVLFDRAFLQPSWRAMRARAGLHAAFAATWLVLVVCLANGPSNPTVGYDTHPRISAIEWLYTQAGVVAHYLRLVVWPHPLRAAYDTDYVRTLLPAVLPGLFVLAVFAVTQLQWRRRPWWAWLGLLCFLLLAPTSTVLPIRSEVVAERRMYLPMLLVVVAAVAGAARLLSRAGSAWRAAALIAVVGALAWRTREHVPVYRDDVALWADAFAKRRPGSRSHLAGQILGNHAAMLFEAGRVAESEPLFDTMMQCEAPTDTQRLQYAASLQVRGDGEGARSILEQFVDKRPDHPEGNAYLGICLAQAATAAGRPQRGDALAARAEQVLRRAVALAPERTDAWNSLGFLLVAQQRWADAEAAYARVTELSTARVEPFLERGELLRRLGRKREIGPLFERLADDPRHAAIRAQIQQRAVELMR